MLVPIRGYAGFVQHGRGLTKQNPSNGAHWLRDGGQIISTLEALKKHIYETNIATLLTSKATTIFPLAIPLSMLVMWA